VTLTHTTLVSTSHTHPLKTRLTLICTTNQPLTSPASNLPTPWQPLRILLHTPALVSSFPRSLMPAILALAMITPLHNLHSLKLTFLTCHPLTVSNNTISQVLLSFHSHRQASCQAAQRLAYNQQSISYQERPVSVLKKQQALFSSRVLLVAMLQIRLCLQGSHNNNNNNSNSGSTHLLRYHHTRSFIVTELHTLYIAAQMLSNSKPGLQQILSYNQLPRCRLHQVMLLACQ